MTTVAQAFEKMMSALEMRDDERQSAQAQQNALREALRRQLAVDSDFLTGSYARRTAIRPLNDIDLFLVLSEEQLGRYKVLRPSEMLGRLHSALATAYPRAAIRVQPRSVNITFPSLGFDVVPVFASGSTDFQIPDTERGSWIKTNPKKHEELSTLANEQAGKKLKPLIKAAKHWNRRRDRPVASFHLEVMSYSAFPSPPRSYPEGLRSLFAHLADKIMVRCPDPAGVGPQIDAGIASEARQALAASLRKAAETAEHALYLDSISRTAEAHGVWRSMLGEVYAVRN